MKLRLVAASAVAALGFALSSHASFALTMQCAANQSIQSGPWPSGATYSADAAGVIQNVSGNDINGLEAGGCDIIGEGGVTLMGELFGANVNVTTDQKIPTWSVNNWRIDSVRVANCSGSFGTAAGTVYSGTSKSGLQLGATTTLIFNAGAAPNTLTTSVGATTANSILSPGAPVYLSLTTAQGSAGTCDVFIYGEAGL